MKNQGADAARSLFFAYRSKKISRVGARRLPASKSGAPILERYVVQWVEQREAHRRDRAKASVDGSTNRLVGLALLDPPYDTSNEVSS